MSQLTIEIDELTLQEAAAALETTSATETVRRALAIATEVGRGRRLAQRERRMTLTKQARRGRR